MFSMGINMDFLVRFFNRGSTGYRSVAVWLRFLCAMSDVEEVSEQSASRRGSYPFMLSDVSRAGTGFQFSGGQTWGRGRGLAPFRTERQAIAPDICFSCGLTGHFRRFSPNRINADGQFKLGWNASQLQQPQGESRDTKPAVTENKW